MGTNKMDKKAGEKIEYFMDLYGSAEGGYPGSARPIWTGWQPKGWCLRMPIPKALSVRPAGEAFSQGVIREPAAPGRTDRI